MKLSGSLVIISILLFYAEKGKTKLCHDEPRGLLKFPEIEYSPSSNSYMFKEVKVKVVFFEDSINVYASRIRRYKSKCTADWGTGQYPSCPGITETIKIPDVEVMLNAENSRCVVGVECKMNGDCYGKESELCDAEASRNVTIYPRGLQFESGYWTKTLHDTCLQTWDCVALKHKTALFLKEKDSKPLPFVTVEGETIMLTEDSRSCVDTKSGIRYCAKPIKSPKETTMSVNCIKTKTDVLCIPKAISTGQIRGMVIQLQPNGVGTHKSFFFDAGQTFQLDHNSVSISDEHAIRKGDAVAMETIVELFNAVKFEQAQSIFNVLSLEKTITDLQNIVIKLVKEASKSNSRFLSEIVGSPVEAKWINPDHALVHNCITIPDFKPTENCVSRFEYDGREWIEKFGEKHCLKTNLNVTTHNLFKKTFLDEDAITSINFIEATQEQDEWEVKRSIPPPKQIDDSHTYQSKSGFLSDILGLWENISGIFYKVGSLFSWILMLKLVFSK